MLNQLGAIFAIIFAANGALEAFAISSSARKILFTIRAISRTIDSVSLIRTLFHLKTRMKFLLQPRKDTMILDTRLPLRFDRSGT